MNRKRIKHNKEGVKNFPIRSTNLFGVNASQLATRKNTRENTNINNVKFASFGIYGATAISNGKDAALGIPRPGPIER